MNNRIRFLWCMKAKNLFNIKTVHQINVPMNYFYNLYLFFS